MKYTIYPSLLNSAELNCIVAMSRIVGNEVGRDVGNCEIPAVGCKVTGATEDGVKVGTAEGITVGIAVAAGLADGEQDGFKLGC